jgi:hypothetical protein
MMHILLNVIKYYRIGLNKNADAVQFALNNPKKSNYETTFPFDQLRTLSVFAH